MRVLIHGVWGISWECLNGWGLRILWRLLYSHAWGSKGWAWLRLSLVAFSGALGFLIAWWPFFHIVPQGFKNLASDFENRMEAIFLLVWYYCYGDCFILKVIFQYPVTSFLYIMRRGVIVDYWSWSYKQVCFLVQQLIGSSLLIL